MCSETVGMWKEWNCIRDVEKIWGQCYGLATRIKLKMICIGTDRADSVNHTIIHSSKI